MALWAKKPMSVTPAEEKMPHVDQDVLATATLLAIVLALLLIGGMKCAVMGIGLSSLAVFFQVVCLHNTDQGWAVAGAAMAMAATWYIGRAARKSDCETTHGMSSQSKCGRWFVIAALACVFTAYATLALTHTFVAPTGLGTVGGKAKLLFLSNGFPCGFFSDPSFMLYQPPYPPGGALFLLLGYLIAGGCSEWIVQLVNCFLAVLLLGFLLCRSANWPVRFLVIAFFVSPLTLRLVTLSYPEVLVGLCMLAGWDVVRRRPLDWFGWIVMGMAGWFKNEGLVYFIAMALPALASCKGKIRHLAALRVVCAMALPVAWHVGCRLCGASLDGYVPVAEASMGKGVEALGRIAGYAFCTPWIYAFSFPLAIVSAFAGRARKLAFHGASIGAGISMAAFCAVFSLSGAYDYSWHLDSAERLLWVPALLLLHDLQKTAVEVS